MRIVGGALRGRVIAAPKGDRVRPTGERAREALFNILAHADFDGFELEGARVLDLFAGSGALGLEALSRGAAFALFVDDHAESRAVIRENLEHLGLNGNAKLYKRDATSLGPRPGSVGPAFSLVFADPPYGRKLAEAALASARDGDWLAPRALCIVEEAVTSDFVAPEGFDEVDRRRYGVTEIVFMRAPA
ncbi:16S rRNA (guanine(966)-N(2))-methyltransferase RsmD [Parvibaculum sp.]|uniref:16S rRNA (guanine(966)-N(2))-methyltransferase RsmD n=1 Tax=Parvibaculum sp. TaxID=2024848 RepID=UPI0034A086C4